MRTRPQATAIFRILANLFCRRFHCQLVRQAKGELTVKLYTYYRSQASFRVRIALNLKGLLREDIFLHLERGDQFAAEYRALNPR